MRVCAQESVNVYANDDDDYDRAEQTFDEIEKKKNLVSET